MKKMLLFGLALSLFVSARVAAQCNFGVTSVTEVLVRDTTFQTFYADTAMGTAGYTWTWTFSDGQVFTGPVCRKPFTHRGYYTYDLNIAGPTGCSSIYHHDLACNLVFTCSALQGYVWDGDFVPFDGWFKQTNPSDPNTVSLTPVADYEAFIGYPVFGHLEGHMTLDWGNGNIINTMWNADTPHAIGGITDTPHSSHYQYAGEYVIRSSYSYSYDTMTCPSVPMPPFTIHVGGSVARPVIDPTSFCVGDALNLNPIDTTNQFHNLFHHTAPGVPVLEYCPGYSSYYGRDNPSWYYAVDDVNGAGSGFSQHSSFRYTWYDNSHTLLSIDTTLASGPASLSDSGNYILRVHEFISNRDTEFIVHVAVNSAPPPVPVIAGAATVCEAASTTLSASVADGLWSGSTSTATVSAGVITGMTAGTTIVTYTIDNGCGITSDTMLIVVNPLPIAGTITGATSVCQLASITLSNAATGGTWSSSSSAATIAGGVVTGATTGTVIISYSVTNSCGTAVDTMAITVNPLVHAGSISGAATVCIGGTALVMDGVAGGTWSAINGNTTISSTGVVTGVSIGADTIVYTVSNMCNTDHTYYWIEAIDCAAGVSTTPTQAALSIYPNPSDGSFTIALPQQSNKVTVTITDMAGKVIQVIEPASSTLTIPVSLSNLPDGTYLVKIDADGKTYRNKVVKL